MPTERLQEDGRASRPQGVGNLTLFANALGRDRQFRSLVFDYSAKNLFGTTIA
jgi:hypothetical protein